jgi:hypothetical protein
MGVPDIFTPFTQLKTPVAIAILAALSLSIWKVVSLISAPLIPAASNLRATIDNDCSFARSIVF